MKKTICVCFAFVFVVLPFLLNTQNVFVARAEENQMYSFVNTMVKMIRENDTCKKFKTDIEEKSWKTSTKSTDSVNHNFQTCRLIVQANKEIEKLNSIGVASGFLDYHIVQFATAEDTEKAYQYYLNCDYVISVSPDGVFYAECGFTETGNNYIEYDTDIPTRLESWGSYVTGTYELKDYLETEFSELPNIKVAVIDSGVDFNHEFLQGRLVKTGFNASGSGTENSEYDIVNGHGTGVTSIIVDNTPKNVKIANYKVVNDEGITTSSAVATAIIKAYSENADFINISLSKYYATDTEYNLINDAVKNAYNSNCMVIAAAGNNGYNTEYHKVVPATNDLVFTVASSSQNNFPSSFTNDGRSINVMAPGEKEPVALPNNTYKITSGTSFSSPLTAAAVALLKSMDINLSVRQIQIKLESTTTKCDLMGNTDMYGYGIIDVIEASGLERAIMPCINLEEGIYVGSREIAISIPKDCEVYYTTDQSYPSKKNGMLYTEPFTLEDDTYVIRAVAYSKDCLTSKCLSEQLSFATEGTADMFDIDKNGTITAYHSDVNYLSIPKSINGIEVTSLSEGLFSDATLSGIIFPETIKELPANLFYNNRILQFASGKGIEKIGDSAFYYCKSLYYVDFPSIKNIGQKSFYYTKQLVGIDFQSCTYIDKYAFANSAIRSITLPAIEIICFQAFYNCTKIFDLNISNVSEFRKESYWGGAWQGANSSFEKARISDVVNIEGAEYVSYGVFNQAQVSRLEFSNATEIRTIPITYCKEPIYGTITLVLPSTLETFSLDEIPNADEEDGIDYVYRYIVYGVKGSSAEQWADENKHKFIEITPKTAIIEDLPDEYYSYMRPLKADIVGFNRIYSWYGTNTDSYENAKLLQTGKKKSFDPSDYNYKYYFCVVKSSEFEGTEDDMDIYTGICENKSYKPYSPPTSNGRVTIATPSNRYLKYGESINLYANATGLPEGAKIKWRIVEGSGVTIDASVTGRICTVTSKSNGNVIIEAYAVNKYGNTIVNENSNRIYDREGISSEVSLWWIILHYIRQMFGITKSAVNLLL